MATTRAPNYLFALVVAVDYSMYMDLRTAPTASRLWKTPFELINRFQPSIVKLHRLYTRSFVTVPLSKRRALHKQGNIDRAEVGRLTGHLSPFSSTYQVMLDNNRLIYSSNASFNDLDCGKVQFSPDAVSGGDRCHDVNVEYHGSSAAPAQGEGGAPLVDDMVAEKCSLFESHQGTPLAPTACDYFE